MHLLVDEYGAPLAIFIAGANEHDKWSADDLIVHIVANVHIASNIFVLTKAMTLKMCINLLDCTITLSTSNIVADVMNQKMIVLFLTKKVSLQGVGWPKEPLGG